MPLFIVLGVGFLILMFMYNGFISRRNSMRNAFASIDVQLKKRWDLVPNLVEVAKKFAAHEKETLEARYILTPSMQDCLVDLRKRVGDGVCIGFRDSKVTLAIPENVNWFEGNVKTPAFDRQQIEQLLAQFWSCFRIVEDLDLNTRIWTKD